MKVVFDALWVVDFNMTEEELDFYYSGASNAELEELCEKVVERVISPHATNGVTIDDVSVLMLYGPSAGFPEIRTVLSGENENDIMMAFAKAYVIGDDFSEMFGSNDEADVVKGVKEMFVASII